MASEIKVDTISEKTSAGGVTIDGLLIKDGGISGDVSLIGTTPTFTIGDAGAEDAALVFDGNAKDFYIALDDSADKLVIGEGSTVGTNSILTITDDSVTVGDAAAVDTKIVFDGNAQDYHIGLDDSADTLVLGLGSTLGTTPAMTVNSSQVVTFAQNPVFPDGGVAVADLDIDGATDIGAAIVDADLFIVDDGAGGTNRKVTASRLKTYAGFDTDAAVTINESGNDVDFRVESDGNANQLFVDGGNNRVTIGNKLFIGAGVDTSSGMQLQVDDNGPNCGQFVGDMNDGGSAAFTFSRLAHDGAIIIWKSASGDTGDISVSGTTVSYNAFTGAHYCEPPVDAVPAYGEIVSLTGTNAYRNDVYPPTDKWRQGEADQGKCTQEDVGTVRPLSFYGGAGIGEIIYGVERTSTPNDRKVLGGYFLTVPDAPDKCAAVGNYDIWIVDKGENIAVGDWLISSDIEGHAMIDDGTTYSTAYVFAMAAENVDWSTVSETVSGTKHKKISVLFERFVRN